MSLEILEELDDARAFEPTHRYEDLSTFHVAFDLLTGTELTEGALRKVAETGGRAALVGPSGAGKSSVIASVLGPLVENLAEEIVPLRIPVAVTDAETATDPRAFTQHLIRTVIRYSTEILEPKELAVMRRSAADQVSIQGAQRTSRLTVGAPKLIAEAGFAAEVKTGAEQVNDEISAGETVGAAARLVEVFRAHGREPFFVIDDSDRWIRIEGTDLREVADAFFRQIVPLLAREIGCGFVIAVHDDYLELASYRAVQEHLSRTISVPMPADTTGAVQAILDRRIQLAGIRASGAELIQPAAIEMLAESYSADRNLRRMLATVNRATQRGCADRVDELGPDLIQTARADLL
jgi:predicted ABC-type transport system involved in lysophospholipase L1 biosynthesis ATPase subunit